ncbi:hypothetical protein M409DRAFT_30507 [Zasmidium cellare ATCC 36951]|uniref:Peptidase S33 tripeptidyl aminopeptidase-like C-terminal domain-containing protein n=1 Tax=Zasmidium cellare ATCC 36951 TaxID=1080233 RepID=A0A6A6BZE9_ZASCE|nr:uncharacterized protein M409DRAFT_30507 [Zasmidium cellare ATCC 36951]KAF2158972.1 hypothetical protein M409DRAFT_30507 [Zasmidium cellare ATCC 36951]
MLVTTGGQYDVIGFDPRGTGATLPINCYATEADFVRYDALAPVGTNVSDTALGNIWALNQNIAQACAENNPEIIQLMGTAFLARDIMQVVDSLEEDGLLRYFGHSYGTSVGQTLAAMFPNRVERMVLDGVLNPFEYAAGWEYQALEGSDPAIEQWIASCIEAGYPACDLAADGATQESLHEKIYALLDEVKYNPVNLGGNITSDIVGPRQVFLPFDTMLRQALVYSPLFAPYLQSIMDRNVTRYRQLYPFLNSVVDPSNSFAIHCGDTLHRTDSLEDIKPRVDQMREKNEYWGQIFAPAYIACSVWKAESKGRYEGDWKAATKNPALLIGSPFDSRTPLSGARIAATVLERSVVLQHNGQGHVVLNSPGQCAIKAMQAYFTNGTLPELNTVCEQDFNIFSGQSPLDSYNLESLVASN